MKRYLPLLILLLFQTQIEASHTLGGEITYKHLGGLKYEIYVKGYRDCRGIPAGVPSVEMYASSTLKKALTLTLVSYKDVTNYCKAAGNPCNPPNTTAGKGVEEHLYTAIVDFNKADSAFKKFCTIQFGILGGSRNGEIGTGASGQGFTVFSMLNICDAPKNSSPLLTSIPNNILCCNQSYFYNIGATDSIDNDSISYDWADPMQDWTSKTSWISGFSSGRPFSDFWPKGYDKNKGPSPSANPPIGTYLDRETGDIIFTPSTCDESTVASIKVMEWRKDSTGKYKLIGEVRRDIQYFILTCPDNNPPLLYGPYKKDVCAGSKICWTITTDDKQFIPPPPAKSLPPDSVTLTWNNGIGKGATFKIVDAKARLQKGEFCWTPKESDANDVPYTFTVTARDNACPRNAMTIKSYSVLVKKTAKTKITKKHIKNGLYELNSEVEKEFKGNPQYFWEISDSIMNPLPDTSIYFTGGGNGKSNRSLDSVQFYKGGTYIIHHRINNPPLNCPTDYFDTLKVDPVTPILKMNPSGIQENWICKNYTDTLFPIVKNAKNPVKYKWSSSPADTLPYLIVNVKQDASYRLDVYDGAGYHRFAQWNYYVQPEPILKMGKDIYVCRGDTVLLASIMNYSNAVYWKWFYEGKQVSSDKATKIVQPGRYSLEIRDSASCIGKVDTIKVGNMNVNADAGADVKVCYGDIMNFTAKGLDTSNGKTGGYLWFRDNSGTTPVSKKDSLTFVFQDKGRLILQLQQSNGTLTCSDLDTVEYSSRPLPNVVLSNTEICQNEIELDLHTLILQPANSYKGIVNWHLIKTVQRPGGSNNTLSDLVYDKDNSSSDHYHLRVDNSRVGLNGKFMDSVILGLTYKDEFGCVNTSSTPATIIIRGNVEVEFVKSELKRCHGDSVKYVSNDYGVNYYGGRWFTINDSSNYAKWPQGSIVQLPEKLGTKSLDIKGGKYLMRYIIENNKCFSSGNTVLTIIPYSSIVWSQIDRGDSIVLTDKSNAERREWYVNSKKMSQTNTLVVSKDDAKFKLIVLKVFNANCETDSIIKPEVLIEINKINSSSFLISPNPVKNDLLIKTSFSKPYRIEIVNSLGQMVMTKSLNQNLETINVSNLSDGIYSLILKTGNDVSVQKFVKTSD